MVNQHGPWSAKRAGTVLLPGADGRHDSALNSPCWKSGATPLRLQSLKNVRRMPRTLSSWNCNGQDSRNENSTFIILHQATNFSQIYHKAVSPGYITPSGNLGLVLGSWIQGPPKKSFEKSNFSASQSVNPATKNTQGRTLGCASISITCDFTKPCSSGIPDLSPQMDRQINIGDICSSQLA